MSPQNEYTEREILTPRDRLLAACFAELPVAETLAECAAEPRPSLKQKNLIARETVLACDRLRDAIVEFLREVQPESELNFVLRDLDGDGLARSMPGVLAGLLIEPSRAGELVELSANNPAAFPAACADAVKRRIQLETFKRCHATV